MATGGYSSNSDDEVLEKKFSRLTLTEKEQKKFKKSIESTHDALLEKLKEKCPKPIQREIDKFYHVTKDADSKKEIEKLKKLEANVASHSGSPIDKLEIEGVYFGLNLKDEDLPTTSPFGTERVCIPISNFSEYELFFNHYKRGDQSHAGGNEKYYVSLVLVKPSHDKYDDIKKVFKKLDPKKNDFVYFDHDKESYKYTDYYKLNDLRDGKKRRRSFNVCYEIVVIGGVPLDEDATWDTVKMK